MNILENALKRITNWTLAGKRSLITTDRQKKPLQHNMTGKECRGGTRGLAGLQRWQLKFLRDMSVAGGYPWELWGLNPKLGSPAYSTRVGKKSSKHLAMKSSRVSVCQGGTAGDSESLLKGQHIKFCLHPLTLGSSRGRAESTRGLETLEESLGLVALGRQLREQPPGSMCWVMEEPSFSGKAFLSSGLSLRRSDSPAHRNYLPHPVMLKTDCWLQLD